MYPWIVFLHVFSGFVFFLSHGASAFVLMKMRTEKDPERLKALLDLRAYAERWMGWSAGILFLSGIVAGFMGRWWGTGWIWVSLVLLVLISFAMTFMGRFYFERVRKALGLESWAPGTKRGEITKPASAAELAAVLEAGNPGLVAGIGLLGLAIIVWLMMFKPF
ncbi:MAG: hypothetical protein ACRDFQ_02275 [Anaerolineales bacterium]